MKNCFSKLIVSLLTVVLGVTTFLSANAQDKSAEMLKKAWREYEFRNFEIAEDYFGEVESLSPSDQNLAQSLVGLAFCYQFGKKGQAATSDYEYAISLYKRAGELTKGDKRMQLFVKAMTAECLLRISLLENNDEYLEQADELWMQIQHEANGTVIAEDALLTKVIGQTTDYTSAKTKAKAKELEAHLKPILAKLKAGELSNSEKDTMMAKVMACFLGDFYYWNKDYKQSVKWMEIYYQLGPSSFSAKANILFTIARVAEMKLKDNDLAVKYYKTFITEAKSDGRLYFAENKIKELSKPTKKQDKSE